MTRRRLLLVVASVILMVVAVLTVAALVLLRPANLRARAERILTERLHLEATIAELDVALFSGPSVSGSGVELRLPGRPDLPPFVSLARFQVDIELLSGLQARAGTILVEGLKVHVPPADARDALKSGTGGGDFSSSRVLVNHLVSRDVVLSFVQTDPEKRPLTFEIHELDIDNLGVTRPMTFRAKLTNPVPRGLVESTGVVGPYNPDAPSALPIHGEYTLTDADLSTINGIGGILQSEGTYEGLLTEILVNGTASAPDFNLDLGGQPVPLDTTFVAIVDGTNGSTTLERVDATILNTTIVASGAITNLPGPGRTDVAIESEITDGRIEDMLALAIDSPEPLLTGDLTSRNTVHLPPGESSVRERLTISGQFGLGDAEFTSDAVQDKVEELSRRGQGKDEDEMTSRVLTDLQGDFNLQSGVFSLSDLAFLVPGAEVSMAGTYDLATEQINFEGTLRMEASVSDVVGGVASRFIKPIDFIFRRDGAGTVVPLKISGTWREPKTSVNFWRILR